MTASKSTKAAREAKAKSIKHPSENGRVLTVKQVPEEVYQTFHNLPHGVRQLTMEAALLLVADFAEQFGPGWHVELLAKTVELVMKPSSRKKARKA
jgi:hypothetical protein